MSGNQKDGDKADDYGAVEIANHLLEKFGISKKVEIIQDCDDEYFLALYEAVTGEYPFGVVQYPTCKEDKIRNCQLVIDSLSKEVLETDLSHIQGRDIVNCNIVALANLLEIFMGLLEYIFEELEREDMMKEQDSENEGDSNLLPNDHEVLSDVFQEEFHNYDRDRQRRIDKTKPGSQSIMEKYLMSTEAPTRDTDAESVSSVGFTQDSLNQGFKTEVRRRNITTDFQQNVDIHPFAYVSSSKSNSTEDLANEAELVNRSNRKTDMLDFKSASTTRLQRPVRSEAPLSEKALGRTDPTLLTSASKKKLLTTVSPDSSSSSANWPSILNTNSLKEQAAYNPYKDVGKRPRDPLPCEVDDGTDDSNEAMKHQHTHHHYHHYEAAQVSRSKRTTAVSPGKSSLKEARADSLKRLSSERGSFSAKQNSTNCDKNKAVPLTCMRSVHTSVSGLETSNAPKAEMNHVRFEHDKSHVHGTLSDRSSVSELNDLLNARNEASLSVSSKSHALKQLNKKLEEVRAAVSELDRNRLLQLDTDDKNDDSRKTFTRAGIERPRSSMASKVLIDNASICSDSECDYDDVTHPSLLCSDNDGKLPRVKRRRATKYRSLKGLLDYEDDVTEKKWCETKGKKKVQFRDFMSENRDERLERLVKSLKNEDRENTRRIEAVKNIYSKDLKSAHKKYSLGLKVDGKNAKAVHSVAKSKGASRPARVYGQRSRGPQRDVNKQRKRSASCSPVPRARRRGRLVIDEDDILPLMEEEFPHLYLSPVTAKMMWQKQLRQISNLSKAVQLRKPTVVEKRIEESQRKQQALMNIMKKEAEHNQRLKEAKEKAHEKRQVKNKLRERRLASARARRYYDEYQVRMRARMLKRKTKEEKIFKKLFEDALQIQKERVRELREYAKEQRTMDACRKQNELESIDNFYRDQFSMMAESVARERYEIQVREKAQRKVIDDMRTGIRQRMEKDIEDLQQQLIRDEDSAYFRQLDAESLRQELKLATYKVRV